jgi:hypothetical protein
MLLSAVPCIASAIAAAIMAECLPVTLTLPEQIYFVAHLKLFPPRRLLHRLPKLRGEKPANEFSGLFAALQSAAEENDNAVSPPSCLGSHFTDRHAPGSENVYYLSDVV